MLKVAARNLWLRKSRSLLAIVALVIGVLAIVILISLTAGLKASFTDLISGVGGVWVMQKGAQDVTLSRMDAGYGAKIEGIPGVRVAIPEAWALVKKIDGKKAKGTSTMMMGVVTALGLDPAKEQRRVGNPYGVSLIEGRSIRPGDTKIAIIGKALADKYKKSVGSKIDVDGMKLTVIGIFEKNDFTDSVVAMHISDARELAGLDKGTVNDLIVQAIDPGNEGRIASTIRFKWPDKFDVYTSAETEEMVGDILGVVDQFFWIIAVIALAIAGIGIVNTMLMAVKERAKEFGVLRAMGWTRDDVMRLVAYESVLLGLAGGAVGILLGYAITAALSTVLPFALVVTPQLALSAFLFSAAAGLVGGAYPAWKASRMDPIKAIRGEII